MGRPQEISDDILQAISDQSRVTKENGNGVEHHDHGKPSTGPSTEQEKELSENGTMGEASVPLDDQRAYENGDTDALALEDPATVSKEEAPLTPEAKLEAEKRKDRLKRLYLVRLPRPVETQSPQQQALEEKQKELADEWSGLNRKIDKTKVERDNIRTLRDSAKAALAVCKEQVAAKAAQLEPHRAAVKARREERESIRQASSDLEYRSEKDLDEAIRALEFALNHETNSVADEKKMIARIKKLMAQRPKVRQFCESLPPQPSAEEVASVKLSQEEIRALEAEMSTLVEERKVQSAIYDQYRAQAEDLDKEVSALLDERRKLKADMEEVHATLVALKAEVKNKGSDWRENRDFSQTVRELVKAGRVEEACALSAAQTDAMIKRLGTDKNFKNEYFSLWKQQRRYSIYQYEEEQKLMEEVTKRMGTPADGGFDADRVIGAVLASATASATQADKATESAPVAPITPPKEEAAESKPEVQGGIPVLPQQMKTLGQMQMAMLHEGKGPNAPTKAKSAKRNKAEKKHIVEVPAIVDDKTPFVPPVAILKRDETVVDQEEEKERARLHNLEAAREAEARKERKRRAAERKAEQKARANKVKEAHKAAGTTKDSDGKAKQCVSATEQVSEEVAGSEEAAAAEDTNGTSAAVQAAPKAAAPAPGSGKASSGKKAGTRPGSRIAGPVAKPRRRKGTFERVIGSVQQQLPKDPNMRLVMYIVASLTALWLVYGAGKFLLGQF